MHKVEKKQITEELPKGLFQETLRLVWKVIAEMKSIPFTTDDLVLKLGILKIFCSKVFKKIYEGYRGAGRSDSLWYGWKTCLSA
ncbi:hypothetical protein [Fictibacillus terranigra]|uniref:Uncharacterized protein n=1 Tax=Fictibacillus terranigra TaxID=3058424 RepID=A0ABT8E8S0_9BACL|nr:hypothetical protein [Fictibacillus sp. CENA-BCM004]MDN4074284.1 hypothetical protein [Fictibacillus sp. CENA-BCM004]